MYTLSVSADRRYQLQSEEANRRIDALLEQLRVPASTWRLYGEMLTAVLKMLEDGAGVADLKITTAALKEMRYGFKVFAPYRHVRKVTVFGSARTSADHAVSRQAYEFGKRMADARVHGHHGRRGAASWARLSTGPDASARSGSISGCPSSRTPIRASRTTPS